MKVISIINQKGGIGKTTTAINLSACLSELEQRVLLIDMDSQANATIGLDIDPERCKKTVYDLLINEDTALDEVISKTILERLDVLPGHMDLAGCEAQLAQSANRPYRLGNALRQVNGDYDYAIIDCPPSLGVLSLNALLASSDIIIPTEAKYYATKGFDMLNHMINTIYQQLGHHINLMGILITMFDSRTTLNRIFYDQIHEYFGDKVFKTLIPRNITLSEAELYRKPVIRYNANAPGARHYRHLAIEVLFSE
jgi:chromosome partitioning protein